jgi:DNA replication licensing factor MCM4
VEIDRGRIDEPQRCPREQCGQLGSMSLIHNRSDFADRQVIRLQETPGEFSSSFHFEGFLMLIFSISTDAVPDGQTPHTVSLCVYDELVDLSKPGDRLTITGIFRAVPVRVNPRQRVIKSLFKTYLDVVHIKRGDGKRMGFDKSTRAGEGKAPGVGGGVGIGGEEEDVNTNLPEHDQPQRTRAEEMEDKLKELSHRQDLYELLARSLAPSIWEMDDVKKGILLQLFGGTNKSISKGGGGGGPRYRGDINVLLVGDPGTSKSQILQVTVFPAILWFRN